MSRELVLNQKGSDHCSVITPGPCSRRGEPCALEQCSFPSAVVLDTCLGISGLNFYNEMVASVALIFKRLLLYFKYLINTNCKMCSVKERKEGRKSHELYIAFALKTGFPLSLLK